MKRARFIGREKELARLVALERLSAGPIPLVLLSATAGMGKSRLVREYAAAVRAHRTVVAGSVRPYAGGSLAPLDEIVHALADQSPAGNALHPLPFERVNGALHGRSGDAVHDGEKLRVFDSYRQALLTNARDTSRTIVFEDVHWAGVTTLEFIHYLMQAPGGGDIALIVTYRSDEVGRDHPLRPLLSRLLLMPAAQRMVLQPLADDDIDVIVQTILVETPVDKDRRNRVRVRAEGNPLFAEELARHLVETRADQESLPLSIEDAVVARFVNLSRDERVTLQHAAVIGRDFDAALLAAVAQRPVAHVLDVLQRARDLAFVVELLPAAFAFRHALIREALYGELLSEQRRVVHADTLAMLEASVPAASLDMLAYHAWAAGDAARTLQYNESAGDSAVTARAALDAAVLYERAAQGCVRADDRARLQMKIGAARLGAGFPTNAIAAFRAALDDLAVGTDQAEIAACELALANAYRYLGDEETGLVALERACHAFERGTRDGDRLAAALCRARIALADRDYALAEDLLSTVEEHTATLDSPAAAQFFATRGDVRLMQRRYDEAILDHERSVEQSHRDPPRHAQATALLAATLLLAGRLEQAGQAYRRAWAIADANLDVGQATLYRAHYAEVQLMLGRTLDARSIVIDLLGLAVQTENPAFVVLLGRIGLFISQRTGDEMLGTRVVERLELDERFRSGTPRALFPVSGAYAQWLVAHDRLGDAQVVLRRAVARLSRKRLSSTDWSICTLITVALHGPVDDLPTARSVLSDSFSALSAAFLSFFDALVAVRAHLHEDARAYARAAAVGLRSFGFCYEEALAWELADERQLALDLFTAQHADTDVGRVQRSLLVFNRRGRAENELTSREVEIATAIAEGQSNRMIAERFCISERTVETHVASIFGRLNVRSRNEIATRIAAREKHR